MTSLHAYAQLDNDEFQPGLIARFTDRDGIAASRVDSTIAFDWTSFSTDQRLNPGPFRAVWQGYLMSQLPGAYQLHVYITGSAEIRLNGEVLIEANCDQPNWYASKPVELSFDWHPLKVEYEASRADSGQLTLYWSGPKFELEPIPARHLFHDPQDSPGDEFHRGARLARALRCEACHRDESLPTTVLPGPGLAKIGWHIQPNWLVDWLSQRHEPTSSSDVSEPADASQPVAINRRMPHFDLSERDAVAIAAMLSGNQKINDRKPSGNRDKGEQLFLTLGCLACHQTGPLGTSGLFGGGDLSTIANKRPAGFFADWLSNPAAINPQHRMPVFELSSRDRNDLSRYLSTMRGKQEPPRADIPDDDPQLIALGRQRFTQYRCGACHSSDLDQEESASRKLKPLGIRSDWNASCMEQPDPERSQPGYALRDADKRALRVYFKSVHPAALRSTANVDGELMLAEHNCLSCHARDQHAGIAPRLTAVAERRSKLAGLLPAMTPPSLTSVGDKLRHSVIAATIRRQGKPHRPYLHVQMPRFPLSEVELKRLADYFISKDRIRGSKPTSPATEHTEAALQVAGARLVTTNGFGCSSCHQIGSAIPPKAPLNARGPDLSMMGKRIRREWYDRFVKNPVRIVPRMEMPSVQLAVAGVLDGRLDDQLESVWYVLNRPDFQPPRPDAVRVVSQSRRADAKPRTFVLTDVLRTGMQVFIKPLLLGLPNRHNVLFDLQTGQLAGWWVGDVAHQQTEGKTWFWEPGGVDVIAPSTTDSAQLNLIGEDGPRSPMRRGQFITEADYWRHLGGDLQFGYRLQFASDRSTDQPRVLHVVEKYRATQIPADHTSDLSPSGFRRQIQISNVSSSEQVRLPVACLDDSPPFQISSDERELTIVGTAQMRISIIQPASARLNTEGSVVVRPDNSGVVNVELLYTTTLPVDEYIAPPLDVPDPEPVELKVVAGYKAMQLPLTNQIMPIALGWKPDGTLIVASLKGRVWLATDTDGDQLEDSLQEAADELAAPYGVAGYSEYIDVVNKFALLRLFDLDGDGLVDETRTVASGWGHTTDYHDWVVGLPRDEKGNYYLAIPCQQDERSVAAARYRGNVLKLQPRKPTGADPRLFRIEALSAGHRFPMGIARNRLGDLFVTDNQGNYNPFNELNHVMRGARYGFINALERKSDFRPPLTPPAIDIPHPWTRSVNGICFLDTPAAVRQKTGTDLFGPFEGHLLGAEMDTSRLVRMTLEKVNGTYQGAAYPFSFDQPQEGPALLGPITCAVSPSDGAIYVGNLRDSGWGGANNVGSVVRLTPVENQLPVGIAEVRATSDGFSIRFTSAVESSRARDPNNYSVSSYTRTSTPAYGGDDEQRRVEKVQEVQVSSDETEVSLRFDELRAGFVYEIRLKQLIDGPFFPAEAHYTLRNIPR